MADDKIRIQWFPGHMTKAKREMQEKLNMVDMVIELRDARIPSASKNPMIEELCQNKPRLIVLSKKDKADAAATKLWCSALQNEITRAVTGDRPGVTRALQWSKVNQNLELLDTPGVLWSKFEDETVGVLLAITGAIRDEILPLEEIAAWAMRYLIANHKEALQQRYDIAVCEDPYIMLERIAEKRGFMRKGEMDEKRTIETFLRELRDDKLGRITWEMPYADSE